MKEFKKWLIEISYKEKEYGIEVFRPNEKIREHEIIARFQRKALPFFHRMFPFFFEKERFSQTLGIHIEPENKSRGDTFLLKSYYYTGIWWIPEKEGKVYIQILPKKINNKYLDFLKTMQDILNNPIASFHLFNYLAENNPIFEVNTKLPPIRIKEEITINTFYIFSIYSFFISLDKLLKKGLKKDYNQEEGIFIDRIKGKFLVSKTLKRFHSKMMITRNLCSYFNYSADCIENKVLKIALWKINRLLTSETGNNLKDEFLISKLKYFLNIFRNISLTDLAKTDLTKVRNFLKMKRNPFYKEYRETLKLAFTIIELSGGDPFSEADISENIPIFPFRINTPLIFELFVLKKLYEKYNIQVKYQTEYTTLKLRPDFIVSDSNKNILIIGDAKYKTEINKENLEQISLYGRIKELANASTKKTKLILYLPNFKLGNTKKIIHLLEGDFYNIKIEWIDIPLKEERKNWLPGPGSNQRPGG